MKRENHESVIMMVIGVLFVLVAGGIFVRTAWHYLPETAKHMLLLLTSGCCFGGAYVVSGRDNLKKTEPALFYLGTAFLGYSMISLAGGLGTGDYELRFNAAKMLVSHLAMVTVLGVRTWKRKKCFDFCVTSFLIDSIFVCAAYVFLWKVQIYLLLFAVQMMAYSIAEYRMRLMQREKSAMGVTILVNYLIRVFFYCMGLLAVYGTATTMLPCVRVLLVIPLIVITAVGYKGSEASFLRVLNSFSIMWLVLEMVVEANTWLKFTEESACVFFIAFVINLAIMIFMQRDEMLAINLIVAPIMAMISLLLLWIPRMTLFGKYPFLLISAVALLGYLFRTRNSYDRKNALLPMAGLQAIMGILIYLSMRVNGFYVLLLFASIALLCLSVNAIMYDDVFGGAGATTAALALMEIGVILQGTGWNHAVEIVCAFLGIGIVLFGRIWYDRMKDVEIIQFIFTCILLFVLLCNACFCQELFSVLYLGVIAVVMLAVAGIKGNKEYAIAAAITLTLIVFYMTRSFWLSIAWWVYLFVAGVGLIVLAICKERNRT